MSVVFRLAGVADVPAVVSLLRDDMLGQAREGLDMDDYIAAFTRCNPKVTII